MFTIPNKQKNKLQQRQMTQVQSIGEVGSGRFCVWWGRRCGLPEDRVGVLVAVKDAYVLHPVPRSWFLGTIVH